MARQAVCDICKRPTNRIVGKLQFVPAEQEGGKKRMSHSNYSHHADVGECCGTKLLQLFNFRPRMTRKEYLASRRG
jgi:hypothetical protein